MWGRFEWIQEKRGRKRGSKEGLKGQTTKMGTRDDREDR